MTKAYVLIYDTDHGNREDCNIFYSPIEVFADADTRQKRIDFIESQTTYEIGYRKDDLDLMTGHEFDVPEHLLPYDDDEDNDEYAEGSQAYQLISEMAYDSDKPADYYFYAFESENPFMSFSDQEEKVTFVSVVPAAFFDEEKVMYDQSVSVDFGPGFYETMECEYEFEGSVEEARAAMLAVGARENAEFSAMIQRFVDDANG